MLTLTLAPEIERRLEEEASQHKLNAAQYAARLIEESLSRPKTVQRGSDALSKWESLNETNDPREIARRQAEFEEFKEAMNRNRLEMEGPLSRKVYP